MVRALIKCAFARRAAHLVKMRRLTKCALQRYCAATLRFFGAMSSNGCRPPVTAGQVTHTLVPQLGIFSMSCVSDVEMHVQLLKFIVNSANEF